MGLVRVNGLRALISSDQATSRQRWSVRAPWSLWLVVGFMLAGCGPAPIRPNATPMAKAAVTYSVSRDARALGVKAAQLAQQAIGVPYRYGGASPSGFDCSGLVFYVYHSLGVPVPRTSLLQHQAAKPVAQKDLRPGDLVFFYTSVEHVGIYIGDNEFVHAPRTGKNVTKRSLREPYFALAFAGGGRVVEEPAR
jgi:cell wall-associated NlpC family hydrolase